MRFSPMIAGRACARLVEAGAALAAAVLIAGCGDNYRPVITPITPSGPAAQVASYAVVVSASPTPASGLPAAGTATVIDYSGDSVFAEAPIGPGPSSFTINNSSSNGFTFNSDGTITNFPVSTTLVAKNITYSTVPFASKLVNLMATSSGLWAADLRGNVVDTFSSVPATFKLAIPVGATPVAVAAPPSSASQRVYAISQNLVNPSGVECNAPYPDRTVNIAGSITPIEISNYSPDTPIAAGICPAYAVESADGQRLFVVNRGDDTITVVNTQINALDACTPFQNQNGQWVTCHPSIQLPAGSGPVYAEYAVATQQLVVANYDGGTVSVIDVPVDQYGNDANTYTNSNCTTYAACGSITGGFGTVHTIPVGNNPAGVTALYDGSRAYSANQADGTVTVVNLTNYTVEKTLTVVGHPRTVVSTQNSEYSKVYVASPDSPYLTIIASTPSEPDQIDTTVLLEGNAVDVRVTTQNGASGNANYVSRVPGYGEPCNLPGLPAPTGSQTPLQACQAIP